MSGALVYHLSMSQATGAAENERSPNERVEDDLRCGWCGYRLTGIGNDANCPECGMSMARSRWGWLVRTASRRSLLAVAVGGVGLALAMLGLACLLIGALHLEWIGEDVAISGVFLAIPSFLAVSTWLLTARLRDWQAARQAGLLRLVARWSMFVASTLAILFGLGAILREAGYQPYADLPRWSPFLLIGAGAVGAIASILNFHYLGYLARRLPRRGLALHLRVGGLLVCLSLGLLITTQLTMRLIVSPSRYSGFGAGGPTSGTWLKMISDGMSLAASSVVHYAMPVLLAWSAILLAMFAWRIRCERMAGGIDAADMLPRPSIDPTRFWPWQWTRRRVVAAAALVLLLTGYVPLHQEVLYPAYVTWRAERLIAQYEEQPRRETARTLSWMLSEGVLPKAVGNRALHVLTRPRIYKRQTYPAGEPPACVFRRPFQVSFDGRLHISRGQGAAPDAGPSSGASGIGGNTIGDGPHLLSFSALATPDGDVTRELSPGTYSAWFRYKCKFEPEHRPNISYRTLVRRTLDFHLVEPGEAEQVRVENNSSLNQTMRQPFNRSATPNRSGHFSGSAGSGSYSGGIEITCHSVPMGIAMKIRYEDQSGKVIQLPNERVARKGEMFSYPFPNAHVARKLAPGQHSGHVIFTPDPEAARPYGSIERIWGGTLRFPVTFRVQ